MKNLILVIIAILLVIVIAPIGFIYQVIRSFLKIGEYLFNVAYSLDQFGNVSCQALFNDILIKQDSKDKFGKPDETISSVIGKNKKNNTLTFLGKALDWFLDKLDKNHSINAIEKDE